MLRPPPPAPSRVSVNVQRAEKTWVDVLKEVGYPTDVIVADFESFYDPPYGLKDLSIPQYISDPQFEVLGLAHVHVDGRSPHVNPDQVVTFEVGEDATKSYLNYLRITYGPNLERCTCVMQNASFDASILARHYNLHPKFIIDTACLARAWHTHSKHGLKDLCQRFGLKAKGDTADFKGCTLRRGRWIAGKKGKPPTMRPVMTMDKIKDLAFYAGNDAAREFEVFALLLPRLSNPAVELRIMDLTLRMVTQPVLRCDKALGDELIAKMNGRMGAVATEAGTSIEDLSGNIEFDRLLTEALVAAGDQPMSYCKVMKSGMKFGLAKDDPELARLKVHPSPRVQQLVKARSAVKSWPLHIARVRRILAMAAAYDGVMPIPLNFHGGHTGRDSGSWNVNLQNLPKRGESEVLAVRGLLIAPPEHELVIVDLSAIEARVLAYLAGQQDLVEGFANNADVYSTFASTFYGSLVRKARKTDPPPVAKLLTERRGFGKICILGCGYGMGVGHFQDFAGCDQPTAEKAITTYREKYTAITRFWGAIEKAFLYTAKYHRPCGLDRGISFHSTDDVNVVMTLPNGRRMNYHKVELVPGKFDSLQATVYNEVEHKREHLWGGVITENLVQAVARDVMMEASIRLADLGYPAAHRIHDELVIPVPKGQGLDVLALAVKELSREPVWARGLPLNAEGCVSERYGLH